MGWWRKAVDFPVKRAWASVSTKVKAATTKVDGGGILKLHSDVQTCGYQDVQVMWEMMLHRSSDLKKVLTDTALDPHPSPKRNGSIIKRQLWRLPTWSIEPLRAAPWNTTNTPENSVKAIRRADIA